MDASRFDSLAKTMAASSSRRILVKRLGGGFVGGIFASISVPHVTAHHKTDHHKPDHCAKEGQRPNDKKPCCATLAPGPDGRCVPVPGCIADGQVCPTEGDGSACCSYGTIDHFNCRPGIGKNEGQTLCCSNHACPAACLTLTPGNQPCAGCCSGVCSVTSPSSGGCVD